MKTLATFLLAIVATGSAFASTPVRANIQEAVLPLQVVEPFMTASVVAAAKKAKMETVIVRKDVVDGTIRYAVRLPASVWADSRLWPSRACGNDTGCLAEFGRLNALPDGWVKHPIARGDAYFPIKAKGMPAMNGEVVHTTRLTRSMQPRAVVVEAIPARKAQKVAQVAPATPKPQPQQPAPKPDTAPQTEKPKQQNAPQQQPKPAPLAPPTDVRVIGTAQQPITPVAYREVVVVQYAPACGKGWNNRTCTERREVSRRVVRVPVTETAVAQRTARKESSPQPAEKVAKPTAVQSLAVTSFAGLLNAFQAGPNELILGVRGGCTDGVCHATFNGKTVSITPQVGNEIIAKKRALKAQEQAVTLAHK